MPFFFQILAEIFVVEFLTFDSWNCLVGIKKDV